MRIRVLVVVGGLFAAILANGGTATTREDQPANGRIAFSSLGRLVVTNPDGTGQWPMTPEAQSYVAGDWSTDGTLLAFSTNGDIYLANPRGRVLAQLTDDPAYDVDPSFAPDGSRILFESTRDGNRQIFVMNADGTAQRRVTTHETADALDAAWSPDGTQIAWTSYRDGNPEIYVMNEDGTDLRRLSETNGLEGGPDWSPDGSRIAFESDRSGNLDVYSMSVDGSDVRRLTTSAAYDGLPEWSPDGTQIAFMSGRTAAPRALFVMDAAGGRETQLSVSADGSAAPAWQPLPREPLATTPWAGSCDLWGTAADDLLVGTAGPETICGLGGDDRIIASDGSDAVVGGPGRDDLVAGPGRDVVVAGLGDDLIDARDGERDTIEAGQGHDVAQADRDLDRTAGVARASDPDPRNLARGRPVRSSRSLPDEPAEYVVDGEFVLFWGSGDYARQWVEIDLGSRKRVRRIELFAAQTPAGATTHVVLGRNRGGPWRTLATLRGQTFDGQVLVHAFAGNLRPVRWIRVTTVRSPSWVAWKEIRVLG
jgi:WD40 repeat protein